MDWTVLAYEKSSFPRKKKKRIVSVSNHLTIWSVSSFGENTVRKSGSAYPIQLPKKKKGNVWFQKFDYSSTFDRRVSEKFPTKGKNHQKQSESVCSEFESLNLHNLLTIRVHYLRKYRMTIHSPNSTREGVSRSKVSTTHPSLTRLIESAVLQVFAKVSIHETVYPVIEKYVYQRRKKKETYIEIHGLSYRKSI